MDNPIFALVTRSAPFAVTYFDSQDAAEAARGETDSVLVTQAADLAPFTKAELVEIHNATIPEGSNVAPATRFDNKEIATTATFANIADSAPNAPAEEIAPPAEETPKPRKLGKGINLAPKPYRLPCRAGTKQAIILDLISRPQGATMDELRVALSQGKPWLDITIKSGLSWDMNSVKGYGIRTSVRGEGENAVHAYHAVFGEGHSGPLAHTPRAADRKAAEAKAKAEAEAKAKAEETPTQEAAA